MKVPKWVWIILTIVIGFPVLIAVIGILAGLLLPAGPGVLRKAEKVHAENTAVNLKNAIATFHTEYGEYPLLDPNNDFTTDSGHDLMDILLGSDEQAEKNGRNPRRIVFISDKAARPVGGGRYRKGISIDAHGGGELWDPWGNFYRVRFDTNGNKGVENPDPSAPSATIPESIIVWSAGPDGNFDSWEDNVKTW